MKSWFSMSAKNGNAEIEIYDEIGLWGITFNTFIAMLKDLGDVKNIRLRVNSPGGDILDGIAVYNALNEHPATIEGMVMGYAASMASVILMAADKIVMPSNTFLFIHNPWILSIGDAEALRKDADALDKMKNVIIPAYRSHAKALSDDDISELMNEESWISAEDAKTYGLIEEVVDAIEAKNSITSKWKLKEIPEDVKTALSKINIKIPGVAKNLIPNNNSPANGKGANIMNTCPKCGKAVSEDSVFCNHCGATMKADPEALAKAHKKELEEAQAQARADERHRNREITSRCRALSLDATFEAELIANGKPLAECIPMILDKIQAKAGNSQTPPAPASGLDVGMDDADKFRNSASNSMKVAAGIEKDAAVMNQVRGKDLPRNLHGLVRACLRREGKVSEGKIANMLPHDLAAHAFRMASAGSSDLPAILADVANKSLLVGSQEAPTTYGIWTQSGETTDFKTQNLIKMSNFSDIDDIPEGFGFKEGKFSDKKETVSVSTKGKKFSLTRQAIINDDLNAFSRIPRAMMGSVARRINRDVYDSLVSNNLLGPTMNELDSDGTAHNLFNATYHNNLVDPSGIPSVTTIAAAERKLLEMPLPAPEKNSATQYANFEGRYLITGTINRLGVLQLLASAYDVAATTPNNIPNIYNGGKIIPVFDPYLGAKLTANSGGEGSKPYAWYLQTDPNVCASYVVYFLAGNRVPTLRNEPSGVGEALGIAWDIFFDWGVGVEDYRGIIYNDGASS